MDPIVNKLTASVSNAFAEALRRHLSQQEDEEKRREQEVREVLAKLEPRGRGRGRMLTGQRDRPVPSAVDKEKMVRSLVRLDPEFVRKSKEQVRLAKLGLQGVALETVGSNGSDESNKSLPATKLESGSPGNQSAAKEELGKPPVSNVDVTQPERATPSASQRHPGQPQTNGSGPPARDESPRFRNPGSRSANCNYSDPRLHSLLAVPTMVDDEWNDDEEYDTHERLSSYKNTNSLRYFADV